MVSVMESKEDYIEGHVIRYLRQITNCQTESPSDDISVLVIPDKLDFDWVTFDLEAKEGKETEDKESLANYVLIRRMEEEESESLLLWWRRLGADFDLLAWSVASAMSIVLLGCWFCGIRCVIRYYCV